MAEISQLSFRLGSKIIADSHLAAQNNFLGWIRSRTNLTARINYFFTFVQRDMLGAQ
jgi:hypothetical protein